MTLTSALLANDGLRALWLDERRAVLQASFRREVAAAPYGYGTVEDWRQGLSLTDQANYSEWLERNGWNEAMLEDALRLPFHPDDTHLPVRPSWLAVLEEGFGSAALRENGAALLDAIKIEPNHRIFLTFVEPMIGYAVERFNEMAASLTGPPFDPATHSLFLPALADSLASCVGRTLILELHVARVREQLSGDSPEQRFQSFATLLRDPDYVAGVLREYPVLARQIATRAEQWVTVSIEFITRLRNDWPIVREVFAKDQDPGSIVHLSGGQGDTHRDGRSVRVVHFASGLRLVYKPHCMNVDLHFHELIHWLNRRGFEPALRTTSVLARDGYGWSEFVAYTPCSSDEEVQRFYQRQGGLLALLYAIDGTDFHMENLIAAGEHPILVDLEALLHPRPNHNPTSDSSRFTHDMMWESVLRVGLLPERGAGKADFSGLGSTNGEQLSPFRVFQFEAPGTDEMRIVRNHVTLTPGQNRPRISGAVVNALEHVDAITEGFALGHELIRRHRHELTDAGGLLDRFADDEIRVVLRATRVYSRVLMEGSHPSLLHDASALNRMFHRLGGAIAHRPYLQRVLDEEIADLEQGCVPLFTSHPSSRDLWSSRGVRIPDFFEQTSLEHVRARISGLDDGDLARQTWFIRASLATASLGSDQPHRLATAHHRAASAESRPISRHELVRMAGAIGDRLIDLAFRANDRTSWVGVELRGEEYWTLKPVGPDLYTGTSGIALFLGYLGRVTRQQRFTDLALTLAENALQDVFTEEGKGGFSSVGPFAGWSGWMYTLTHLSQLSGNHAFLEIAHEIGARAAEGVETDRTLDIIAGTSGLLLALAALQQVDPRPETLRNIIRCADHLTAAAAPVLAGVAWVTDVRASAPLTGLSHGASGIAWSLMKAAQLTGDNRYRDVAFAAMTYERAVFLEDEGNWPDYREPADGLALTAWCHGAPGIGLVRVSALTQTNDPLIAEDLERAISATLAQGFGKSHCLCHGDLGNLELLREAARVLQRTDLAQRTAGITAQVAASIRERGLVCGTAGIEVPGLMTGIAGIGMGLLRQAHPDTVPSPLTLDSPITRRQRTAAQASRSRRRAART